MIRKTITYSTFFIVAILIVLAFITAKNYTQLALAVVVYPILVYFAYRIFMRGDSIMPEVSLQPPTLGKPFEEKVTPKPPKENVQVIDVDKRTFLKFVGAAGISFFLFSLLGRRVEELLWGRNLGSSFPGFGNNLDSQINANERQSDEYQISEIDEEGIFTFYGFTKRGGAWFIMKEDPETGTFRYAKGDQDFLTNWENRLNLKYDYYHNLF